MVSMSAVTAVNAIRDKRFIPIRADMRQSGAKEQWNTLACVF